MSMVQSKIYLLTIVRTWIPPSTKDLSKNGFMRLALMAKRSRFQKKTICESMEKTTPGIRPNLRVSTLIQKEQ